MNERLSARLVAGILFVVLLGGLLWYTHRRSIVLPEPPTTYATTTPLLSPETLVIPKLNLEAHIQHVGIAKSGNMAVPTNYTDVGWYRLGAAPGEEGNAVIAGHLDNGFGFAAIFKHLSELQPGDEIIVYDATGTSAHFIVERLATYDYSAAPMEEIFGTSTDIRLNLITCDGLWDPNKKMYSKRLIVFTKAQPHPPTGL